MGEVCAFLASQKLKFHSKHRRTPMSPPQLIPPTSPVQVFAGDGRLRRMFLHTGHGPFRTLIVSNLNGADPVAATTCFRQADIKIFRDFFKSLLMAYRISRKR